MLSQLRSLGYDIMWQTTLFPDASAASVVRHLLCGRKQEVIAKRRQPPAILHGVITRKIMNMFFCKPVKKLRMSGLWCYLEVHFSLAGLEFQDAFAVILHLSFILVHVY
jgi:hypothetical protein